MLVTGATVGIIRSITATTQRLDLEMKFQQESRSAISAVTTALRNIYRPSNGETALEGIDDWRGDLPSDTIRFLTISHRTVRPGQPESDVQECEFFLSEEDDEMSVGMIRRTDPTRNEEPDGGGVLENIARNIVGMDFSYHDGEEWVDEWEARRKSFPLAIRVRLIISTQDDPHRMRIVTRTVSFPYLRQPSRDKNETES